MKGVIDRFEGDHAIIELDDRQIIEVERKFLPSDAREGDVLLIQGGRYTLDLQETIKRKENIKSLTSKLWK